MRPLTSLTTGHSPKQHPFPASAEVTQEHQICCLQDGQNTWFLETKYPRLRQVQARIEKSLVIRKHAYSVFKEGKEYTSSQRHKVVWWSVLEAPLLSQRLESNWTLKGRCVHIVGITKCITLLRVPHWSLGVCSTPLIGMHATWARNLLEWKQCATKRGK